MATNRSSSTQTTPANGIQSNPSSTSTTTSANGNSSIQRDGYEHPRLSAPIHAERHMRILCIGAGASGLAVAYKLQRSFNNFNLVIYEKNADVAGTWFENRYPGCACDIPAHIYVWSFEPKHDWSGVYAGADEIRGYFESFADKYGLRKYLKVNHEVVKATWVATASAWDVEVKDLATGKTIVDTADIVINATGYANKWKWPDISGLKDFGGALLHTSNYDRNTDLAGKRVGVIGNGASGIQVVAEIQPQVAKLTHFMRSRTFVSPVRGFEQRVYTPEEIEELRANPAKHLAFRKVIESRSNSLFPVFLSGTELQKGLVQATKTAMEGKIGNASISDKLLPDFALGCRRWTPGPGYMECLSEENVEVVFGEIEKVTEQGCVSAVDGREHELDVLICATGFDGTITPRFEVVGEGGRTIREEWAEEPKAYFGMGAAGFPNYFMIIGPNSPIATSSILLFIEKQVDFILKFVNRWQTENIKSMSPKREAIEELWVHKNKWMEGAVWSQSCNSWYKAHSASGKVSALWCGSVLHFMEAVVEPRYEDWNIEYEGNRFAWLGNGYSQTESDPTADWSFYLRNEDDSPFLGRKKALEAINKSGTQKQEDLASVWSDVNK